MSRVGRAGKALMVGAAAGMLALTAGQAAGAESMGPISAQEWWLYGALDYSGAWPTSLGDGVTVGVIGDVVDSTNADLSGSLQQVDSFPPNLSVTDADVGGEDCFGNEAASLIAGHGHATSGGSDGVIGLAAHAKILPIAVGVDNNHIAVSAYLSQAIHVAVDGGAKVLDVILPAADDKTVHNAIDYALARGAIVVAPSGNNTTAGNIVWTPAAYKGVLAVGGIQDSTLGPWPKSAFGSAVSVAAPATNIMADGPAGGYQKHDGTNCAAALVAAEVALVWSVHPAWTSGQVEKVVLETASGNGRRIDDKVGFGTVNPIKAVAAAAPAKNAAPLGSPPALVPSGAATPAVAVPAGGNSPAWMIAVAVVGGLVVVAGVYLLIRWQRDRKGKLRRSYPFQAAPIIDMGPSDYGDPPGAYGDPQGEYGPYEAQPGYPTWAPGPGIGPTEPVQPPYAEYPEGFPEQREPAGYDPAAGYTHWSIGMPEQPAAEQSPGPVPGGEAAGHPPQQETQAPQEPPAGGQP